MQKYLYERSITRFIYRKKKLFIDNKSYMQIYIKFRASMLHMDKGTPRQMMRNYKWYFRKVKKAKNSKLPNL